jgi:hypothetical protein
VTALRDLDSRSNRRSYGYRDRWTRDTGWIVAAVLAAVLLGLVAIYGYSARGPLIAGGKSPETTGQSTRPTLPTMPN